MKILAQIVTRRAGLVSLLGTVLAIVGCHYSVLLYRNLRPDIEELLPTSSRSVQDLNEVTERLESIDNIVTLVFSNNTQASKKFVNDLAKELSKVPKDTIHSVEYRIDHEISFFKQRRTLYIDLADLIRIRNYIRDRISYETALYNPLNIFSEANLKEPKLDFEALKRKYERRSSDFDHLPGGYYASADEKVRAVVVYMPGKGLEQSQRMKTAIENAVSKLNPKSYAPDMEVKYTGNVQNMLEESQALVADLELSTVIVVVLVTLAMIFFYKSLPATLALVFSLFMGTLWTFGVAYYVVGYLNANTAFLASIVIGNGINFGIIFLARYMEERRGGRNNSEAMEIAIKGTVVPTTTAALAAGLSYGSLMLTGFRGFSQFGIIGLIGMIFCWISSYTMLPALLTLWDRWKGSKKNWIPMSSTEDKIFFLEFLAKFVNRFPGWIWAFSVTGVIVSLTLVNNYKMGLIETDLTKLRNKNSMEHGSGALYHYIDDIFKHSFSPMVILPKSRESSREIARLFKEAKEDEGKDSLITSVQTLDDFVPLKQDEKIKVLKEIRALIPYRIYARLPDAEQKLVTELLNSQSMKPFTEKDIPRLVLDKFTEKDGSIGKIVLVDKLIQKDGDDANALVQFVKQGREITDSVAPKTAVAGTLPISYDMFEAIIGDGPKATLFAFLSVVFLVIVMFRNLKTIVLVLFALLMGVTWLGGIILGFHLKINFLNFIALPITFGIGVDYGANIFSRYRQDPGNILKVIRETGGAVILCSLTTIIGYSSLLLASNQAFVSFGRLAVLGELTCVVAAVISLPAFLTFRAKKKKQVVIVNEHQFGYK